MTDRVGIDAADRRHRLRAVAFDVPAQLVIADGAALDELAVDQILGDDDVHHRVEQRDIGVRLELQVAVGDARKVRTARVADDQPGAVLRGVLDPGRGHRVIHRRVGADEDHHLGLRHVHHRIRHRAGADALEQRVDRRGVAQPRAVIDVVAAEAGSHQLLEQVSLLVAALGRAEAGERFLAVPVANLPQLAAGRVERLFPCRFAEHVHHAVRVHREVAALRCVGTPDQRFRQSLRVVCVVEAIAALDAQSLVVGRAVSSFDVEDPVVLDVVGELTTDAAKRTHGAHLLVGYGERNVASRHQRTGRARLDAFAAGHAGRCAHRVVHVEHDLHVVAAKCQADDIVDLLVATGAHTAGALDACVEMDGDGRVRQVFGNLLACFEAWLADGQLARPLVDFVVARVARLRHVGQQQLEHHLLRLQGALAVGRHLHAGCRCPAARGRQHTLAVDLDHAGAAVADRLHPFPVAKVRYLDAFALRDLDQRLGRLAGHLAAVELEGDERRIEQRGFLSGDRVHLTPPTPPLQAPSPACGRGLG